MRQDKPCNTLLYLFRLQNKNTNINTQEIRLIVIFAIFLIKCFAAKFLHSNIKPLFFSQAFCCWQLGTLGTWHILRNYTLFGLPSVAKQHQSAEVQISHYSNIRYVQGNRVFYANEGCLQSWRPSEIILFYLTSPYLVSGVNGILMHWSCCGD